ncbi:EAL domain-containing protein [Rhizobium leguminosarum]|uniref:Diguanylate cyclase (GGDEF)-like protein n=1 Tax=Rhizobium leguminosarum TaxID=384 RepID=A0A7W9ZQ67_RHILE|nr:diguanylate cyclase (GGDEF)-like protein [Rhizobium leguminosarum]
MNFDFFRTKLKWRLATVAATSFIFVSTLGTLGYTVAGAFHYMASVVDDIDDARAVTAAKGALRALQKQLGATVRDNAYWDDAFSQMSGPGATDWATENWGSTTANYPLYDTAMALGTDGNPIMAYHKGEVVTDPNGFYLGKLAQVIDAARRPDPGRDGVPVSFIKTQDGIAIIGAAAIQPSAFEDKLDYSALPVLVFSKQLTPTVVAEISATFTISGLALQNTVDTLRALHAELKDMEGHDVGYLTWPHVDPGTTGYLRVRPTVVGAGIVLILLLTAVGGAGFMAFRSISSSERRSAYEAKHDALTGLLNRVGCFEQLEKAVQSNVLGASLLMIDLDGFKPVNDAWGHAVGDELLRSVAARLVDHLPDGAIVARLGGDEFAVISRDQVLKDGALAARILTSLSSPFVIGGRTIEISCSVGAANMSDPGTNAAELLRRADLALYRSKDMGRGRSMIYSPSLDEDAANTSDLEQELRHALASGQIRTVFQPLVDATTREIRGVEALARWKSATRGDVTPEVFISLAERAGLIDQLGFEVLRLSVREASRWPGVGVAVNVSPLQLRNPYFASQVGDILAQADFDPMRLTIEVTEGVLISNPDQAKRAFKTLRNMGIKIALDDFGCGYASIGALREFGFDRMKIDRSLIVALDHDDRDGAVLHATIALANALHLPVTAEGIETEEQAAAVRLSGCDELQGYLFSRPASADQITQAYFAPSSRLAG